MSDSDTRPIITRSLIDRRSGVDSRSVEEQQRVGERRSGIDRRQTTAPSAEDFARQVSQATSVEDKLNLLALAVVGLAATLAGIERRIRVVQKNTADDGF
jgi:hypothetical protein